MLIAAILTAVVFAVAALWLLGYGITLLASKSYDGDFGEAIKFMYVIVAFGAGAILSWSAILLFMLARR